MTSCTVFRSAGRWSAAFSLGTGAALVALVAVSLPAGAAELHIDFHGVRSASGTMRVAVYADPKTFRKEEQALERAIEPARQGTVTVRFPNLAPGRYAVIAYHDEDGNGKLNRFFGMAPTEGTGLSNNPKVMGPPDFEPSAFELPAGGSRVSIDMHY